MSKKTTQRSAAGKAQQAAAQAKHKAESREAGRVVPLHHPPMNPSRRESCRLDLGRFLRTYLPARFPLAFSQDHNQVIAGMQAAILTGGLAAYAMPRGSGKTTLTEGAALWAMLYEHRRFPFLIGSDAEAAAQSLESIKSELEHNDILDEDFSEATHYVRALDGIPQRAGSQMVCATPDADPTRTLMLWTGKSIRLAQVGGKGGGCVVRTAGITGRIRGAKASLADGTQVRPDLALIDDPQTDESAASPSQINKRVNVIVSTIIGLAGPGKNIAAFCPCTVIQNDDVAHRLLDRSRHPEWHGIKIRMMKSMPRNMKLWDQYAEIRRESMRVNDGNDKCSAFYNDNRKEMDDGAEHYWPERVIDGDVSAIQSAMNWKIDKGENGEAAFAAEMQNEPIDINAPTLVGDLTAEKILSRLNHIDQETVPDKDTTLTAAIDVQGACLYYMVCGWDDNFSGDIITYGTWPDQKRLYFSIRDVERTMMDEFPGVVWASALDASLDALVGKLINTTWNTQSGGLANITQVFIDGAYGKSTEGVKKFCRVSKYRTNVRPYFGSGKVGKNKTLDLFKKRGPGDKVGPMWRMTRGERGAGDFVVCQASHWKSFVAERLHAMIGSKSYIAINGTERGRHRMLADHLSSERPVEQTTDGNTDIIWKLKQVGLDNHLWDTLIMNAVNASTLGVKHNQAEAVRIAPQPSATVDPACAKSAPSAQAVTVRQRSAPSLGGWLDGGSVGWP